MIQWSLYEVVLLTFLLPAAPVQGMVLNHLHRPEVKPLAQIEADVIGQKAETDTRSLDEHAWVQTGLKEKSIRCLVTDDTRLLAGTPFGGVYRSTDGGESWTQTGLQETVVQSLAANDSVFFAGTTDGVFRSTDRGATWWNADSALTNRDVNCVMVDGPNAVAGTWHGVMWSTDGGRRWDPRGLLHQNVKCLAVHGSLLFAGTSPDGVLRSSDGGASWRPTALTGTDVYSLLVMGENVFAGTWGGVFVSTDSGRSWTLKGLSGFNVKCLAGRGGFLVAGTWAGGVFLSTNGGSDWTAFNTGLTNTNVWAIALDETTIFVGTEGGGVWRRELPTSTVELRNSHGSTNVSMSKKEKE
jgi:ligand-binding sensor domain-containing protein